ncbi:uncharacterized protein B0T15DRAFT_522239 [Chaetomium strumarium]|uniref:Uncharacterized protein n=1 Tax=Chaetomium strumarium TaxID=1170767 RepID=A0AAJ0H4I3_9PEZI|nr:hypothetical protein B0T15DRAFT_522239 [Chaetomium strumarium]
MNTQRTEGYVDPSIPTTGTAARPTTQNINNNPDPVYSSSTSAEPAAGQQTRSASAARGEQVGRTVKGLFTGVHGAGESLRGGLNAAVDKAFGTEDGLAKDDVIAQKGESELKAARGAKNA